MNESDKFRAGKYFISDSKTFETQIDCDKIQIPKTPVAVLETREESRVNGGNNKANDSFEQDALSCLEQGGAAI